MTIGAERLALGLLLTITLVTAPMAVDALVTNRDDKGVWFITGSADETIYDIFDAMGYAVATDRLWQAEKLRRKARGRLAEIFGPGETEEKEYLVADQYSRIGGYSDQELSDGFDALNAEAKEMINGYVDGFNRRIAETRAFIAWPVGSVSFSRSKRQDRLDELV